MTFGSFTLIKDEAYFIKDHLEKWLPSLDEMVFYIGDSTDGTDKILKEFKETHKHGNKLKLFANKEPVNMQQAYIDMSNECMRELKTDMCIFLHPDMIPENAEVLKYIPEDCIAATMNLRSFGGEPYGVLYELDGRSTKWKNIYRLNNPDLGAHYWGGYGVFNEDVYFSEITGNDHVFLALDFDKYPYPVFHSELKVNHFSDVRPYARRLERMTRCMLNQGHIPEWVVLNAPKHPRVSLKDDEFTKFKKIDIAEVR